MSVTDLTGTTWVFNDTIDISSFGKTPQTILMPADVLPNDDSSYYLDGYIDDEGNTMTALVAVENARFHTTSILVYPTLHAISSGSKLVITGGTDVTNSALISWVESNAKQQTVSTKVSVDLTTLPGWASLSSGSHSITIVAKADGYRDSEPSAAVSVEKVASVYTDCITFTGETSDFTLAIGSNGAKEWDGTVEYSTDHNTWTAWDGTAISSVNKKLYLRGKNNTKFYTSKGVRLSLSAKAGCSGNIQTLLNYETLPTSISANNCFRSLFSGCNLLTTPPSLPAMTLSSHCYFGMFYKCTSLTYTPELPATNLAPYCYYYMFSECTSITSTPELPATSLDDYCYGIMFAGCTSLKSVYGLPATTLSPYCYFQMFLNCKSLNNAPELPADILSSHCYYSMFANCTSLIDSPNLPATSLADYCYNAMFQGCSSLKSAPLLPASTLNDHCYAQMFTDCTSLKVGISSGTKIFTCPSNIPNFAVDNMFTNTGGTFKGTPTAGNTYYWYE